MFRPTLKVKENVLKLGLSHLTKRKQTNKNNRKILYVRGCRCGNQHETKCEGKQGTAARNQTLTSTALQDTSEAAEDPGDLRRMAVHQRQKA